MDDFTRWLYTNYIKPQLGTITKESDYALRIELLQGQLDKGGMEDLDKALEFTAIQAFLLGLRTGQGLPRE